MDVVNNVLNNPFFVGFMTVFTVLYASLARPMLPPQLVKLFDYPVTKMIIYALIVFIMTQNLQVAIVIAIAFYILMSMIREQKIAEGFMDGLQSEGFLDSQLEGFDDVLGTQDPAVDADDNDYPENHDFDQNDDSPTM